MTNYEVQDYDGADYPRKLYLQSVNVKLNLKLKTHEKFDLNCTCHYPIRGQFT
jgi:hypothetical protein